MINDLTIVIPVYNEGDNIDKIYTEIRKINRYVKIIFVDDYSTDKQTINLLKTVKYTYLNATYITSESKGQQSAMLTGIKAADTTYVGVIDCDMQDPVKDLFKMYSLIKKENKECVIGVRKTREDKLHRKIFAKTYYSILSKIAGHPVKETGEFFVIKQSAKDLLDSEYLRGSIEYNLGYIRDSLIFYKYNRVSRQYGKSHYSVKKLIILAKTGIKWTYRHYRKG